MPLFVYSGDISLHMHSFDYTTTSPLKSIFIWIQLDTVFGGFYDDNVCACAVGALILLSVVNLSPEMDSATPIS